MVQQLLKDGSRYIATKQTCIPNTAKFDLPEFALCDPTSSARYEIERFIELQFFKGYGAELSEYLPWFVTMSLQSGLTAASGFALAVDKTPFFLERYLRVPIEQALSDQLKSSVSRVRIAEVGNLAGSGVESGSIGSSRLLYIVLASTLAAAGLEWMVFTATAPLLHSLARLGLKPIDIGPASQLSLDEAERGRWGSYYEHNPRVIAAPLVSARESIRNRAVFASIQGHYSGVIEAMALELTGRHPSSRRYHSSESL